MKPLFYLGALLEAFLEEVTFQPSPEGWEEALMQISGKLPGPRSHLWSPIVACSTI